LNSDNILVKYVSFYLEQLHRYGEFKMHGFLVHSIRSSDMDGKGIY